MPHPYDYAPIYDAVCNDEGWDPLAELHTGSTAMQIHEVEE